MDWHRVDSCPRATAAGWTGYSWNRELFPDPEAFLAELHRRDLRVTLNVHPADGVRPYEDAYPAMAEALGRDPDAERADRFRPHRPDFLGAYFDVLHQRLEDQGVDFWWLDWQPGGYSRLARRRPAVAAQPLPLPGLRPRRPAAADVLALRRAGQPPLPGGLLRRLGDHAGRRWSSSPSSRRPPSNIGYGWWSHDIGGHFYGSRDDELAARWVQLGVFSPILRLHSSSRASAPAAAARRCRLSPAARTRSSGGPRVPRAAARSGGPVCPRASTSFSRVRSWRAWRRGGRRGPRPARAGRPPPAPRAAARCSR